MLMDLTLGALIVGKPERGRLKAAELSRALPNPVVVAAGEVSESELVTAAATFRSRGEQLIVLAEARTDVPWAVTRNLATVVEVSS